MPPSQPAIGGDFGISPECPTAPSMTISAVAAISVSANSDASAGAHRAERTWGSPRSPWAATLTKRRGSQRRPDGLALEVGAETVVAVLAADAGGLEASE